MIPFLPKEVLPLLDLQSQRRRIFLRPLLHQIHRILILRIQTHLPPILRQPMNILSDGLTVLLDHWRLISVLLLILLFGLVLISSALKNIFGERLTADEYFSLGLAGWM